MIAIILHPLKIIFNDHIYRIKKTHYGLNINIKKIFCLISNYIKISIYVHIWD